ncbi:MAG: lipoprotein [Bacteroidota bacterium]|jgi:hypothetical protein|nr:lipoprotein [Bacteroidota bacterium]
MKINYKTGLAGLTLLLSLNQDMKAQMITFHNHYSTTIDQSGKDVVQTADGGYLIAGTTENSDPTDLDMKITKTDAYGNIVSTKIYGGARVEYPNNMVATSDGNYLVVGFSQSFGGGDMDVYLMKIDANGNEIFTKSYGGFGNEEGKEIIATADGNYIIVGASNSYTGSSTNNDIQLFKIDPNGTLLTTRNYGTSQYESARSIKLCSDGGFVIAGKTAPSLTSNASLYLVRTNANLDTMWTRVLSGAPNSWEGKSVIVNSDNSLTLAIDDSSVTNDSDIRIMKLNSDATSIITNNRFGDNMKDIVKTLRPTNDGGYILGGISRSFGWPVDMWVIKLDGNCNLQWDKNYGGAGHEHAYSIRQTSDGGYIAVGHARSYSTFWELYLVKMGQTGLVGVNELALNNSKASIYPNPTDGVLNIDLSELKDYSSFTISNTIGQTVYSEDLVTLRGNQLMTIDLKDQKPGVYFVTIQSANEKITKKLILN